MSNNVSIQINEINRLINYDRSKTLFEQPESVMDRRFGITNRNAEELGMGVEEYENLVFRSNMSLDELSSALCGDNSLFAGLFKIPWIEYKSEELFCDVLAGALMVLGGPIGIVGGVAVEFLHAKDLWNKGDKTGAWISMIIGLIPVIGDVSAKGLRVLLKKIGTSGITKVARVFIMTLKFMSGEIKASRLILSMKNLSVSERKMLYNLWSTSSELVAKSKRLSSEFDNISKKLSELGYGGELVGQAVKRISEILDSGGPLKGFADFLAQTGSIMGFVIGAEAMVALGHDPKDSSFETMNDIMEFYKNNEEEVYKLDIK